MLNLEYFLYAITVIRLIYLTRLYLKLVKEEELKNSMKCYKIKPIDTKKLKNFCIYLNDNDEV